MWRRLGRALSGWRRRRATQIVGNVLPLSTLLGNLLKLRLNYLKENLDGVMLEFPPDTNPAQAAHDMEVARCPRKRHRGVRAGGVVR